jgi:hypothetical protein
VIFGTLSLFVKLVVHLLFLLLNIVAVHISIWKPIVLTRSANS